MRCAPLAAVSLAILAAISSSADAMVYAAAAPMATTRLSCVGSVLSTWSPEVWYQRRAT